MSHLDDALPFAFDSNLNKHEFDKFAADIADTINKTSHLFTLPANLLQPDAEPPTSADQLFALPSARRGYLADRPSFDGTPQRLAASAARHHKPYASSTIPAYSNPRVQSSFNHATLFDSFEEADVRLKLSLLKTAYKSLHEFCEGEISHIKNGMAQCIDCSLQSLGMQVERAMESNLASLRAGLVNNLERIVDQGVQKTKAYSIETKHRLKAMEGERKQADTTLAALLSRVAQVEAHQQREGERGGDNKAQECVANCVETMRQLRGELQREQKEARLQMMQEMQSWKADMLTAREEAKKVGELDSQRSAEEMKGVKTRLDTLEKKGSSHDESRMKEEVRALRSELAESRAKVNMLEQAVVKLVTAEREKEKENKATTVTPQHLLDVERKLLGLEGEIQKQGVQVSRGEEDTRRCLAGWGAVQQDLDEWTKEMEETSVRLNDLQAAQEGAQSWSELVKEAIADLRESQADLHTRVGQLEDEVETQEDNSQAATRAMLASSMREIFGNLNSAGNTANSPAPSSLLNPSPSSHHHPTSSYSHAHTASTASLPPTPSFLKRGSYEGLLPQKQHTTSSAAYTGAGAGAKAAMDNNPVLTLLGHQNQTAQQLQAAAHKQHSTKHASSTPSHQQQQPQHEGKSLTIRPNE